MSPPALVFIHLGPSRPRWLIANAIDHQERFKTDVFVVVNSDRLAKDLREEGIGVWFDDSCADSTGSNPEQSAISAYRAGFWRETSNRFLALARFHQDYEGPLLQVETDNVLFDAIQSVNFESLSPPIAFPMASPQYGLGSILYSRDPASSRVLAKFFDESIRAAPVRSEINDMTRLAEFFHSHPGFVQALPTAAPGMLKTAFPSGTLFGETATASFESYGGVFDALTLGQYVTGQDPRNFRGRSPIGAFTPGFFPTQPCSLLRAAGDQLFLEDGDGIFDVPVFNIHVHSKQLEFFSSETRPQAMSERVRRLNEQDSWSEFRIWGFWQWFQESLRSVPQRLAASSSSLPS